MPQEYLLFFAQTLEDFRIPEVQAVCQLLAIKISYDHAAVDLTTPFMVVTFESEEDAKRFAARSILLKAVYEFWSHGKTYEEVFQDMQTHPERSHLWRKYVEDTSFRFSVTAYKHTISSSKQRQIVESFSWMAYKGPIRMQDPELEVCVLEDWEDVEDPRATSEKQWHKGVWVGKKIAEGQRILIDTFDLKKRVYIGNTSMAAEVSLIMANQALAGPGKLVYDPFVGTGSIMYPAAFFGARVVGSDIDGRHIRGKDQGVMDSARQYGVRERVLDCLTFDLNLAPWRVGEIFDAIVTDPPYGVRAGAKRLGRKDTKKWRDTATVLADGTLSHERSDYVPPSMPWELSEVLIELLKKSLYLLKPGGRLVYWLPTVVDEYQDSDVPALAGLKLVANSEQNFGKWSRRLITMEKVDSAEAVGLAADASNRAVPAHFDFRTSYFAKSDR